ACSVSSFLFFFQAEDGIRDRNVTGVQTCALPILTPFSAIAFGAVSGLLWLSSVPPTSALVALMFGTRWFSTLYGFAFVSHQVGEIGRASCRERVEGWGGGGDVEAKRSG